VSSRVSPTGAIRSEIDAVFAEGCDLAECLEDVARLIIQTALEAEVDEFLGRARYERADRTAEDAGQGGDSAGGAGRAPQRPPEYDDQDGVRAGHRRAAEAARHHREVRLPPVREVGDPHQRVGIAGALSSCW
jgi:hypothetical protein